MNQSIANFIKSFYCIYYKTILLCNNTISKFDKKYSNISIRRNDLKDLFNDVIFKFNNLENKFSNSNITEKDFDYYTNEVKKILDLIEEGISNVSIEINGIEIDDFEFSFEDDEIDLSQLKN